MRACGWRDGRDGHMARASLSWELPEDGEEFEDAYRGGEWRAVVWEVRHWLRERLKYGELKPPVRRELEALSRVLYSELSERRLPD